MSNPRKQVVWFAEEHMERRLCENDDKNHWSGVAPTYLVDRLGKSYSRLCVVVGELRSMNPDVVDATLFAELTQALLDKTADVANYAMMLADNERNALLAAMEGVVQSSDEYEDVFEPALEDSDGV